MTLSSSNSHTNPPILCSASHYCYWHHYYCC